MSTWVAYLDSVLAPNDVVPRESVRRIRGRSAMTLLIAWRNLVHDRMRFVVTLVGIAFSTILMGMQLGLLLNFIHTTSTIVDHADADLWIAAHGVRTSDLATPIEQRRRFEALSVDGVAAAESVSLRFGNWKRSDGIIESVIVLGVEPHSEMGLPWGMVAGRSAHDALAVPDGLIIDRLYAKKLGVDAVDQIVEINDRRARVTGFTEGIRTFTQSPFVFTSIRNARRLRDQADDSITYVLVRLAPGHQRADVARALAARIPEIEVLSQSEFATRSNNYWLWTTGAGVSLVSSTILALMVGTVVVAQTLYASTMDRLPEYATIRAMGGPRSYLYKIVIQQAVIGGLMGYVVGIGIVGLIAYLSRSGTAPPEMPWWLASAIAVVTVLMCVGASLVSLNKVVSIDPVTVFR